MSEMNLFNYDESGDDESPFDKIRRVRPDGTEYWTGRDLNTLTNYASWQMFEKAIERAVAAINNLDMSLTSHVNQVSNVVERPQGGSIPMADYELSRFAAYLVMLNGDPRKPEIAAGQAYFVVRTREAEVAPPVPALTGPALMAAALVEAQATLEARDAQIAVMTPKAEYVDMFVDTDDLIEFRTLANQLTIKESDLRTLLIEHRWIYMYEDTWWSKTEKRMKRKKQYRSCADKHRYFQLGPEHEAPRIQGKPQQTLFLTPEGAVAVAKAVRRWTSQTDLLGTDLGAF